MGVLQYLMHGPGGIWFCELDLDIELIFKD
jgi:hypothetical protein